MQVLGLFRIKMFVFFEYMQVWGTSGSQNLHILKKIKVLIVKSHQTYIYSKKIKTSQTLCCIDELVFDFLDSFEYMRVLCALLASKCWFFFCICRFWAVPYQNVCFFLYMQVWGTWGSPNLHILKKDQHFDAKSAQNLHILKKIKSFDSEKSPNLYILKKIKKIKNLRLYVGLTGIDELVFDFFDFFVYMQVWWLFTIKTFDFFEYMEVLCTFGIKMLFFLVWGFGEPQVFQTYIFATKNKNAE